MELKVKADFISVIHDKNYRSSALHYLHSCSRFRNEALMEDTEQLVGRGECRPNFENIKVLYIR